MWTSLEALKTQNFIRVSKSTRTQKYFRRRTPASSYALASWNLHSEFCTRCTKSFVWAFSVNPSIFSVTHLRAFSFLVNFGMIMLPNVAILFKRRMGLNSLNFRVIGIGIFACPKKWKRLVSTTSVRKMYEGDNTKSSKRTMPQLKEHEQQQDNYSLIHMFWHHMLQLYSLRMRYFKLSAIFLVSVNAPLSCRRGKRGEGGVVRAHASQGGVCAWRPSVTIVSNFLYIKVLYFTMALDFILFSYFIFFLFIFIFIFYFFLSFVYYCFFLSRGYLLLQRLCISEVWINFRVCVTLVCYTAVFSVVTQCCSLRWGRSVAWRHQKHGCVVD